MGIEGDMDMDVKVWCPNLVHEFWWSTLTIIKMLKR